MAERETGERWLPPQLLLSFLFFTFVRFPRSRDHPEGLLAVYFPALSFWIFFYLGKSSLILFSPSVQPLFNTANLVG